MELDEKPPMPPPQFEPYGDHSTYMNGWWWARSFDLSSFCLILGKM